MESINVPPTNHIRVLDGGQGWIGLIDHMGTEVSATNAARVSFGKMKEKFDEKDEILLKYLVENKHMTPLEHITFSFSVHCPLFIARQWMRHRCLTGDNELWFDLPNGKNYKMKISDAYRKWNKVTKNKRKDRQGNSHYSKDLISKMRLKFLNENTNEFETTNIIDIFENGEKDVFKITLSNGMTLRGTKDHKILTETGWKEIGELSNTDKIAVLWSGGNRKNDKKPWFFDYEGDIDGEVWKRYKNKYLVSSFGRVKTTVNTKNVPLKEFRFKKKTIGTNGYPCVSISENGNTFVVNVHTMMAEAFGIKGDVVRHLDDNKLNCALTNLDGGTENDNRQDSIKNGGISKRKLAFFNVVDIIPDGKETVYDITVNSDFHNFIANGIVVHNCFSYNEISRRYTAVDLEFYFPDTFRKQSESNRQASTDEIIEKNKEARELFSKSVDDCFDAYEKLIEMGVCKEQARSILPQNMFTTFWMTGNLRNILHFIELRDSDHAQKEIREYAKAMKELIRPYVSHAIKYFEEK